MTANSSTANSSAPATSVAPATSGTPTTLSAPSTPVAHVPGSTAKAAAPAGSVASSISITLADRVTAQHPQPLDRGAHIAVIGAGVVGAALADELVLRGCTHVTVIDQGPLPETGGSSSHAPGFVFQVNPSRVMCQLAQNTLAKLDGLQVDGRAVLDRTGGLELASTEGQLLELRRRLGFARAFGVPAELVSPERVAELWPGIDTTEIIGALHTPNDGVVHSKRAVEYQLARAKAGGAQLLPLTRVVDIATEDGRVTGVVVEDAVGDGERRTIAADTVVATGGI